MKVFKKKPSYSEVINEKYCSILTLPPIMEPCETVCNTSRWHYSDWSMVSSNMFIPYGVFYLAHEFKIKQLLIR